MRSYTLADFGQGKTWQYDGGLDIHESFKLSGEPMSPELMYEAFAEKPGRQYNASEIAKSNIEIREFRKEYMERWNATKEVTGTGRPIDGLIAPLAPSPSSEPLKFRYYNYTTWVNLLDYPSCVIPVTEVNREVDLSFPDFKPLSNIDADLIDDCEVINVLLSAITDQFYRQTSHLPWSASLRATCRPKTSRGEGSRAGRIHRVPCSQLIIGST